MIRALRDKGWSCTGRTEPSQAGNRPEMDIRDRPKWRFLCEIDADRPEQVGLGVFGSMS